MLVGSGKQYREQIISNGLIIIVLVKTLKSNDSSVYLVITFQLREKNKLYTCHIII